MKEALHLITYTLIMPLWTPFFTTFVLWNWYSYCVLHNLPPYFRYPVIEAPLMILPQLFPMFFPGPLCGVAIAVFFWALLSSLTPLCLQDIFGQFTCLSSDQTALTGWFLQFSICYQYLAHCLLQYYSSSCYSVHLIWLPILCVLFLQTFWRDAFKFLLLLLKNYALGQQISIKVLATMNWYEITRSWKLCLQLYPGYESSIICLICFTFGNLLILFSDTDWFLSIVYYIYSYGVQHLQFFICILLAFKTHTVLPCVK